MVLRGGGEGGVRKTDQHHAAPEQFDTFGFGSQIVHHMEEICQVSCETNTAVVSVLNVVSQFVRDEPVALLGSLRTDRPRELRPFRNKDLHEVLGYADVRDLLRHQHCGAAELANRDDEPFLPAHIGEFSLSNGAADG